MGAGVGVVRALRGVSVRVGVGRCDAGAGVVAGARWVGAGVTVGAMIGGSDGVGVGVGVVVPRNTSSSGPWRRGSSTVAAARHAAD
ncbi:hypothetical protein ACFSUK_23430 [Sphingobium scionense]